MAEEMEEETPTTSSDALNMSVDCDKEEEPGSVLERIRFANVRPFHIPRCLEIEKASYPPNEAASKSSLQYRQHHAAPYFRCAYLMESVDDMVARLRKHGAELIGEVVQYEDIYRLCYMRGPAGIVVALAEELF